MTGGLAKRSWPSWPSGKKNGRARSRPPARSRRSGRERMLDPVLRGHRFSSRRLAGHGALDRLLDGLIVELMDLLVVFRQPVDEDADADEEIVGFVLRDGAVGNGVRHGLGDRVLRRTEHLDGLLGTLDRHLVEQDGIRLAGHVWRQDGEQRGEAVLVVREGVAEGMLCRTAARSDDQVDMGNFVALADQGLADHNLIDPCHGYRLPGYRCTMMMT